MEGFDTDGRNVKRGKPFWRELAEAFAIALVLAAIIRALFLGMYWVPSESMAPTIAAGDRLIVSKFSYWFHSPERGQVAVFATAQNEGRSLVKRIIALPGETVAFRDNGLWIDGVIVDEGYLPEDSFTPDFGPVVVPADCYFVCGDNRLHSSDSRTWGFVAKDELIGRAMLIYWPLERMGRLK